MTDPKYKAHLVTGGLSGTNDIANDANIVNHFTENTTPFSKAVCVLGNRGYNPISLKTWLYPAQLGGFVLPSDNEAMRAHMRSCGRTALGVWAIGNDPADHVGESTPTLNGGFQSQNRGGIMPKSSKRATAQAQSIIDLLNDREREPLKWSQLLFKDWEWHVPKRAKYGTACHLGNLYAHAYAQYLKENRDIVGAGFLGHIAKSIDFTNENNKGFWVGFFAALEGYIQFAAEQIDTAKTAESRAIILKMRRKLKGETARNIRHTLAETFSEIKRKLARWADDNAGAFSELHPIMSGLSNRDADNYEPLLAIAQLAGGDWVRHIEQACIKLMEHSNDNKSIGVELLEACRDAFDVLKVERIKNTELLEQLLKDEEAPFLTYNRGKPITIKQISRRLSDYGVRSKTIRFGYSGTSKGYERSQFNEAFTVYLDGEKEEKNIFSPNPPIQIVTSSQLNTGAGLDVTICENVTVTKTQIVTPKSSTGAGCDDVTIRNTQNGENLQNQPKSTYKRRFSNVLTEAESQSNLIGITDEELLKQFEREFLKTGADRGRS